MKATDKHIEFIRLVANGLPQNEAWIATNSNRKATAKYAKEQGCKWAKIFTNEIQNERERLAKVVEGVKDQELVKKALNEVLSVAEVDAKLSKIISGEEIEVKQLNSQGKVFKASVTPSIDNILKATDIFYKRFGSNAPTKTQLDILNPIVPERIKLTFK